MCNDEATCFQHAKCLVSVLAKVKTFGRGTCNESLGLQLLNSQRKSGTVLKAPGGRASAVTSPGAPFLWKVVRGGGTEGSFRPINTSLCSLAVLESAARWTGGFAQ